MKERRSISVQFKGLQRLISLCLITGVFLSGFPILAANAAKRVNRKASLSQEKKKADAGNIKKELVAKPQEGKIRLTGTRGVSSTKAVINVQELSDKQAAMPTDLIPDLIVPPNPIISEEDLQSATGIVAPADSPVIPGKQLADEPDAPQIASPNPITSFLGHNDVPKGCGASGTIVIPPDTTGAVGLDKVVTYLNNNYIVQNKTTGTQLSCVSGDTFWSATGATGTFDPRIIYDPYNNRWIIAAVAGAQSANSSILVGISNTSDPSGAYTIFSFQSDNCGANCGTADDEWSDYPMLGFNKNWVTITVNMFTNATNAFTQGRALVIDYPTLRTAGTLSGTYFASSTIGFCNHPATTFSATEDTLYFAQHIGSAGATYKLNTMTGTAAAPVFNINATLTRPGGGWTQPPSTDQLPQNCVAPACTALRRIETGDAQVRSNVVFRNSKIWYPQTIALPAGGFTVNSRTAVQWTALNTNGTVSQGGRIEDATATQTNGGKWYAFPSLSVNMNDDVMVGFSEFESDDFVDAGYAFRRSADTAGTMRDPIIYKEGEGYYEKTFGGGRNRWGDYSHTVVDPSNDRDLWTLQEYAAAPVGTGDGSGRWSTWWAKIAAVPTAASAAISGRVTTRGGAGLGRVTITLLNTANGTQQTTQTRGDGSYEFAEAAVGSFYVLSASRSRYDFKPDVRSFNLSAELKDADFTATR